MFREWGFEFEVMSPDIDEKAIRSDDPKELVSRLARAKAKALLFRIKEPAILITSDQVVEWNGKILEKPQSEEEMKGNLKNYGEIPPKTITSVYVINTQTGKEEEGVDIVRVVFKPIPEEVIESFAKVKAGYTRAGGLDIDDPFLMPYVKAVEGERESVIGLPRSLTEKLLKLAASK